MPERNRYRHLPGETARGITEEMTRGLVLALLLVLVHRLFGKQLEALTEAAVEATENLGTRRDRVVNIHADIPANVSIQHEVVPVEPPAYKPEPDDGRAEDPAWRNAMTHYGDGSLAYQPIDPTDTDWPDPNPTDNENRTAMIEPGADLLAMIRSMPNPTRVPLPQIQSEFVD